MALTSVFYDGPVTETDRATSRAGAPDYGVYGPDDFNVSAHPSIPYALVSKAGKAHGWGVTDTATTDQTVHADTLSGSGAVRFDLVVVNRNWQPLLGGPSALKIIKGGSTAPNIQTIRTIGPGVEDDQPTALVEWRGNQNTPYRITDLRCWAGNGGMVAADLLALGYLARPGASVRIGGVTYLYDMGANGVWGWVRSGAPFAMAAGYADVPNAVMGGIVNGSVTFPPGRFSVPPIVQITTQSFRLMAATSKPTVSGFAFTATNFSTAATNGATRVHWTATQMTPSSAAD